MSETCVVHLVRAVNGIAPFQRFVESYRKHPAGVAHDLVLIFKGFDGRGAPAEYAEELEGLSYETFDLPDQGFDIGAYFLAAREFDHRRYCFLNSFSVILDTDWLAKLCRYAGRENAGLVGASGSWESHYTNQVALARAAARPTSLSERFRKLRELAWWKTHFDPFPNYHLRTNAFMLKRDVLLALRHWDARTKEDAYKFESGKRGLTRQVLKMGAEVLVVGRDGEAYEKERWYESCTFRSGDQSNLLVADNRTLEYLADDESGRKLLAEDTWGKQSEAPPCGKFQARPSQN
ncbi:MAG TPA: hypothetical protein VF791_03550 [Pyrinomonadaceae bacterium]